MPYRHGSGRKPLPRAIKLLRGCTPVRGPDRSPKPEIVLPAAPDYLDTVARREWTRVAAELYELGVLSNLDVGVLAAMCSAHSAEIAFTNEVRRRGPVLYGAKQRPYPNPFLKLAAEARRDKVRFGLELGYTP